MGWITTVSILVVMASTIVLCRYQTNKEYEPGKPRYIPWNVIMFTAAFFAILMIVRMFSLAGFDVGGGRPL